MSWMKFRSTKTGDYYFYNTETKESRWDRPKTNYHIYHILVKHIRSRNPVNDLTPELAAQKIHRILNVLEKTNENEIEKIFLNLASRISDCSSKKCKGYLGELVGGEMYPEFEEVAFALKRKEFSGIISTPSGFHILYRK